MVGNIRLFLTNDESIFSAPVEDIIFQCADSISAMLYHSVFFPDFIEIDGSIIIKRNIENQENRFYAALENLSLTRSEIEASFNLVEIAYMFHDNDHLTTFAERKLATLVRDAWKSKLHLTYPNRNFQVNVIDPERSGSVYCVEFFEIR